MIQMPCPQCGEVLEMDPGFIGGVARCKYCAALFTVPEDAAVESAKVIEQTEDYESAPIAARPRNTAVRVLTAVALAAVLLGIVGAFVGALLYIATAPTQAEREAQAVGRVQEALAADPFADAAGRTALGVPLAGRAVVVVDAHYLSQPWIDPVNAALRHGLTQPGAGGLVNLVYSAEPMPLMLAAALIDASTVDPAVVESFTRRVAADGSPPLADAVRVAVQFEPAQVVIVVGRELANDELSQVRQELAAARPSPRVDVVMVDKDDPGLDALATSTGGMYVPTSQRRIRQWQAPE